jgi:hypothetical protein
MTSQETKGYLAPITWGDCDLQMRRSANSRVFVFWTQGRVPEVSVAPQTGERNVHERFEARSNTDGILECLRGDIGPVPQQSTDDAVSFDPSIWGLSVLCCFMACCCRHWCSGPQRSRYQRSRASAQVRKPGSRPRIAH